MEFKWHPTQSSKKQDPKCVTVVLWTPQAQTAMSYHPLQRVDEVLQVNVISVRFDVCQEEVVDPLSDLTLKNHRQHSRRQLQDEDEANHAWKLMERTQFKVPVSWTNVNGRPFLTYNF